jgi:hypothetical protein
VSLQLLCWYVDASAGKKLRVCNRSASVTHTPLPFASEREP